MNGDDRIMEKQNSPSIPPRQSSKRAAEQSVEQLQASKKRLAKIITASKQRLTRNSSYDAE